jgi:hypothetical protein
MLDNHKTKSRKRSILIEVIGYSKFPKPKSYNNEKLLISNFFTTVEPQLKNRFIIELEDFNNKLLIESEKIKSFNFYQNEDGEKKIVIESYLEINEWVDNFLKVEICKIFLLNPVGDVVNYFDYDIANSGYEYELNYSKDDLLVPKFFYTIL